MKTFEVLKRIKAALFSCRHNKYALEACPVYACFVVC